MLSLRVMSTKPPGSALCSERGSDYESTRYTSGAQSQSSQVAKMMSSTSTSGRTMVSTLAACGDGRARLAGGAPGTCLISSAR